MKVRKKAPRASCPQTTPRLAQPPAMPPPPPPNTPPHAHPCSMVTTEECHPVHQGATGRARARANLPALASGNGTLLRRMTSSAHSRGPEEDPECAAVCMLPSELQEAWPSCPCVPAPLRCWDPVLFSSRAPFLLPVCAVVPWCCGAVVVGCCGVVVPWCCGAVVVGCVVLWCLGAVVVGCCGAMLLGALAKVLRSHVHVVPCSGGGTQPTPPSCGAGAR